MTATNGFHRLAKPSTALERQDFALRSVAKAVKWYIDRYGDSPEVAEQLRYALEGAASSNRKEHDERKRKARK